MTRGRFTESTYKAVRRVYTTETFTNRDVCDELTWTYLQRVSGVYTRVAAHRMLPILKNFQDLSEKLELVFVGAGEFDPVAGFECEEIFAVDMRFHFPDLFDVNDG